MCVGICRRKYHQVGRVRVDENNQLEPAYHTKGQSNCGGRRLPRINLVNYSLCRVARSNSVAGSAAGPLNFHLDTSPELSASALYTKAPTSDPCAAGPLSSAVRGLPCQNMP